MTFITLRLPAKGTEKKTKKKNTQKSMKFQKRIDKVFMF